LQLHAEEVMRGMSNQNNNTGAFPARSEDWTVEKGSCSMALADSIKQSSVELKEVVGCLRCRRSRPARRAVS
jgi:hypothetical protein